MLRRFIKPEIYGLISHTDLDKLNRSTDPNTVQLDILKSVLSKVCILLRADSAFLINLITKDEELDAKVREREINETLFLNMVHVIHARNAQHEYDTNFEDPISEKIWKAIGNPIIDFGGKTFQYDPNSEDSKHDHLLPMPRKNAEIIFMRIGEFAEPTQFALVIHKYLDPDNPNPIYATDLIDRIDLITARLSEFHLQVLHRYQEILYDNQHSAFVQDILHQVRNSIGGLSESIEYIKTRYQNDSLQADLDVLYILVMILGDTAESSYLAAEKRSIFEVYNDPPVIFRGRDWLTMLNQSIQIFSGEVAAQGLQGIKLKHSPYNTYHLSKLMNN